MLIFLIILLIPVLIGIAGLVLGKGRISWKEFAALEAAVILVVGSGLLIARHQNTSDDEIWSGRIAEKKRVTVSCEHVYRCNPYPCGKDNKDTCYHKCYEHTFDYNWVLFTSNGEEITIAREDRQGTTEPRRYTEAKVGQATALSHSYTNYIKASPWSVLRKVSLSEEELKRIPEYPISVYNYHYCDRFISVGVNGPDGKTWNQVLQELNADLGKRKQVNIIFLFVNSSDPSYQYALEQGWIGGKKNDLVVIVGTTQYPKIDWVRIMSWSQSEQLKVDLRDELQAFGTLTDIGGFTQIVRTQIEAKFVRRPMAEFEYLMAAWEPSGGVILFLLILSIALSGGLCWYFYNEDPFGDEHPRYGSGFPRFRSY